MTDKLQQERIEIAFGNPELAMDVSGKKLCDKPSKKIKKLRTRSLNFTSQMEIVENETPYFKNEETLNYAIPTITDKISKLDNSSSFSFRISAICQTKR